MALFDIFKKKKKVEEKKKEVKKKEIKKKVKKPAVSAKEIKKPAVHSQPQKTSAIAYRVLKMPQVTEKATDLSAQNQYVFKVPGNANKFEIARKIEHLYGVRPIKVRTMNFSGKKVRYGRTIGKRKSWKKAVVVLRPEDKLEIYEGV